MLIGAALVLYPIASQSINGWIQSHAAQFYSSDASSMPPAYLARLRRRAEAYNDAVRRGLTPHSNLDDDSYLSDRDYMSQLALDERHGQADRSSMIGRVIIPKISVDLPIRHGTNDFSLDDGVGHLYGTSLPIGGKGTNSVLAAHRGLPTAMLFTRLDELRKGDIFYLSVLGTTMAYKVDAIWVVKPNDVSHFRIDPDRDRVTLLTCTPYGVNTERLLVRGTRTAMPRRQQADTGFYPTMSSTLAIFAVVLVLGLGLQTLRHRPRRPIGQHLRSR